VADGAGDGTPVIVDTRRFGRAISASLFLITMAAFLRPPLLPDIGRDLSLTAVGLGALGSVFAIGRLLTDLPIGRLSDRIAPARMMGIAAGLVAVGGLVLAAAPTALIAFVGVFVLGSGSTWTMTTAQAWFAGAPKSRRGAAMSMFAGSLLTAQAIGPAAGGALGAATGWRVALGAGAVTSLAVGVWLLRLGGPDAAGREEDIRADAGQSIGAERVPLVVYLLPAVQFSIGAAMVQTLVPIIADDTLGLGVGMVGVVLGVGGLSRLVAAVVAGRVMDERGRRQAMIPGLVLQLAGVAVFAFVGGVAALWVSIVLVSLGSVSVNVGTAILADLSEGGRLGPRLGAFRFTGDVAFVVAPFLSGVLLDGGGRALAMSPLVVLTAFVLVGAAVSVPETHPV